MGTDRLIYIRTDGNSAIATGHLVRCLSVAAACLSLDMKVCFLVSDKESEKLLRSFDTARKFPIHVLKTAAYDSMEKELPELIKLLSSSDTRVICKNVVFLLDSYYVTETYLRTIKSYAKTAYLDDLQLFDYPADLIINYDVIPKASIDKYKSFYQSAGKVLLGASYTPLRSQFSNKCCCLSRQVANIFIATGGSDPYHFCLKLTEAFQKRAVLSLNLHIVVGRLNKDKDMLQELSKQYPYIILHENVSDMASLMESCDLAVSAAGTTLYELCSLGIPAISFTMADNQLTAAKAFSEAGAIPCAGDIRICCETALDSIMEFVTCMSQDYNKRKSAHENMRRLVDGQGSLRIAKALWELSAEGSR